MAEIKKITSEEFTKMIESKNHNACNSKYKPLGLYYLLEGDTYIGVDNSEGDAWTEEFDNCEDMIKWLKGDYEV